VERIEKQLKTTKNILVFGDYDVDGTTAVSVGFVHLRSFIRMLHIPDRYDEGYGISFKGIDFCRR
jgi:single-stranded-DNA-specific exonuclease